MHGAAPARSAARLCAGSAPRCGPGGCTTPTSLSEADLARWITPIVRGWMQYFGAFYPSALHPLLERVNAYLMRWMRKKFKRLRGRKKARTAWGQVVARRPRFFVHWAGSDRTTGYTTADNLGLPSTATVACHSVAAGLGSIPDGTDQLVECDKEGHDLEHPP
ncbi:group II intron maturase-specific domain-containing protein [Streptomyces sp. NPDC005708]|uniref:group II intron maturase-specific domain-containing protein n=1 Tax=Streptomyces sp. NPDC005708 TaxID=3154564 RepID=UPI0033D62F0E